MKPGARLQAAIDVVAQWQSCEAPLDEILAAWGRSHRFAGAKDRKAIAAAVYATFRRYAYAAWRMGAETPRALVLGALDLCADEIDALCTGDAYAPSPLTPAESVALRAMPGEPPPRAVLHNCPAWLLPAFENSFGDQAATELAALNKRAPVDLRVNALKAARAQVLSALRQEGIDAAACAYARHGLRLPPGVPVLQHAFFHDGLFEVQDEGSQLASLLCGAKRGQCVVDLAAGAGGKALALAAEMSGEGRILACDVAEARLARLAPRAARAGVRCIEPLRLSAWTPDGGADPDLESFAGHADMVVVDAPCSGSGTWRRAPEARFRLTPAKLATYVSVQQALLDRAARLVKPGGRLAYITCSVFRQENEDQAWTFLRRRTDFSAVPPARLMRESALDVLAAPPAGIGILLTPARYGTDGFFIAVLERAGKG